MPPRERPIRALVVDPHANDGKDLRTKLAGLGYEVVGVAPSIREALLVAARAEPQIALIDAALDEPARGFDAGWNAFLRGRFPLLFTVREDDHRRLRRVRTTHPGRYLLKPIDERELRMAIAGALATAATRVDPATFEEDFFDISIDMLCCLGFDGYFTRLNPAWERVLGFTREELMSRPFIEFVHPDDRERTLRQNRQVRGGGSARQFENRYLCSDGSYRWLMWNAAPDVARNTIYSVARDITERKSAEEALERLSTTDELTGLRNRRGFASLAEKELNRAARRSVGVLLFYIDLDRFKEVNDTFGHAEGDRVLVDVARLLQESCRGSDVVARVGGDEFVLLALDEHGEGERIISERIRQAIDRLNAAGRHPYVVGLTIGAVYVRPGEETDLDVLLGRADRRMYLGKRGKRTESRGGSVAGSAGLQEKTGAGDHPAGNGVAGPPLLTLNPPLSG